MSTHRVNIFNKTYSDHIAVCITDDFELEFFPAEDGFLNEYLTDQAGLQTAGADCLQLLFVVYETAAGTAHRICRAQDYRIAQTISNRECLIYAVRHLTACHLDPDGIHGFLELNTILTTFNRVYLDTDDLNTVFFQNTGTCQLCTQVQTGLATEVWQQCIRTFLGDDLLQTGYVERLNIGHIRDLRIGHDRGRVRIDQHDLVTQLAQCLTSLCTGIVELTRLTDDDRTRADDQHFVDICSLWHK